VFSRVTVPEARVQIIPNKGCLTEVVAGRLAVSTTLQGWSSDWTGLPAAGKGLWNMVLLDVVREMQHGRNSINKNMAFPYLSHMRYREFAPGPLLKQHVQCYFVCETDMAVATVDHVFATGFVEILFNLDAAGPQQIKHGNTVQAPRVQLWGQTIQPFTFTSVGKHAMLGIRFFAHSASCFFGEPPGVFNDRVTDFTEVAGPPAHELCDQLLEAGTLEHRLMLVEQFLLARLLRFGQKNGKLDMLHSLVLDLQRADAAENLNSLTRQYNISTRYLRKLFLRYTGLSPHLFSKIARFRKSLLVAQNNLPLTAIAYECGYYDQSHFIKDFRFFTGLPPSHFQPESSSDFFVPLSQ
jgi:AraC-like DNA-binding protein